MNLYYNFEIITMQSLKNWTRFESCGRPIYINGDKPDWFVPGKKSEFLLQKIFSDKDMCAQCLVNDEDALRQFLLMSQLDSPLAEPYQGRSLALSLTSLKECWFHLTDACNLSCRHCLFGASPAKKRMLPLAELESALVQARTLGCSLFYFTGGEPFVYPHFVEILGNLLEGDAAVHAVVLTNGLLLKKNIAVLQKLPQKRLHLQISLDGLEKSHDALRGRGSYADLSVNLSALRKAQISATLSVAVNRENITDLSAIVDIAAQQGVCNIHLLWHFVRGKGSDAQYVAPKEIWQHLEPILEYSSGKGVVIDNVEIIKAQVFSTPGTRHDLSNSGWESLAIGPDGMIYPSPALVGISTLRCGSLGDGLGKVWRNSPVLDEVRRASIAGSTYEKNPLRFLVGGGDIDHSYIASGNLSGNDPYVELYNNIALWLIARQAEAYPEAEHAGLLLKMGDVRYDCPDGQEVALTHCNCVISLTNDNGHASVLEFYGSAANAANEDIVNPFAPAQAEAVFIPAVSRKRSYGCGSPVHDAQVKAGETVVDLGSGSGVECFLASEMVGPQGLVYGIDMTDEMLALARMSQKSVVEQLGYDKIEFKKGYLEAIPLDDNIADVVISNCVINLSPDKRQTLHEAYRVLKSGGRLVVSDIVTDGPVPVAMKNDEKLRGECLGGAMQQEDLMAMLRATGFTAMKLIKRFPYRVINDTPFYSLTFAAYKPDREEKVDVIYRGPFAAVYTEQGKLLLKGKRTRVLLSDVTALADAVFIVDQNGAVTNVDQGGGCCALSLDNKGSEASSNSCCPSTSEDFSLSGGRIQEKTTKNRESRQHSDCLVCGGELRYFTREKSLVCYYCGEDKQSNAACFSGHFVCDACHQHKGVAQIKKICTEAAIEDMVTLMKKIRSKPAIAMHGPEHHAMVPGIIVSSYRARGGKVGKKDILTAIERGSKVPGGVCGFWGSCGAAMGAGIAFSVILEATPLTPKNRQLAQGVTAKILERISSYQAGRCCQRETLLALQEAARLSVDILPVSLLASDSLHCSQYQGNRECIRKACPFWETRDQRAAAGHPLALVI